MNTSDHRSKEFLAIDGAASLVNALLDGGERLLSHNLHTARCILADLAARSASLTSSESLPEAIRAGAAWAQPVPAKVLAYWRRCYEISADTQEELCKRLGEQYATCSAAAQMFTEIGGAAPLASQFATQVVEQVAEASDRLFEATRRAVEPVAQIVEAGVEAVADATARVASAGPPLADESDQATSGDAENRR